MTVESKKQNGTFYLFYDKNQMVQSTVIPDYIKNAECKLTLFRNCRNTENIALTSLRFLGLEKSPKLYPDAVVGEHPEIGICTDENETIMLLNAEIDKYIECKKYATTQKTKAILIRSLTLTLSLLKIL